MKTRMKLAVAMLLVMLVGLVPCLAYAADSAPASNLAAGKIASKAAGKVVNKASNTQLLQAKAAKAKAAKTLSLKAQGMQAQSIVDSGTFGTCTWKIENSNGEYWLLIYPADDAAIGYLDPIQYDETTNGSTAPWYQYSQDLHGIIVLDTVVADRSTECMFCDCPNLEAADLSGLDTSYTEYMNMMFWGCTSLSTIYVTDKWSTDSLVYPDSDSDAMFFGCVSLIGGNGTPYQGDTSDSSSFFCSSAYANIDTDDNPGYLTSLNLADASVSIAPQTYNGTNKTPPATVYVGSNRLTAGEDYMVAYSNNRNAGTATATILPCPDSLYVGSKPASFRINPAAISSMALRATSFTYNGRRQAPAVASVNAQSLRLSAADYNVAYSAPNSVNAGAYTVTVKGKGNFTGAASATYRIIAAPNKAKAAKTSVKKTIKKSKLAKKAQTVALPKVKTTYGKAKWSVAKKDKKKVLTLSGSKVKVKKKAKPGEYTIRVKATVKGTANYNAATSKVVTVKVTVK